MKLVTYISREEYDPNAEMFAPRRQLGQGGIQVGDRVYDLSQFCAWADDSVGVPVEERPNNVQEFLELTMEQQRALSAISKQLPRSGLHSFPVSALWLRAPLETPPSLRDFYAFEQHVKTARALRGLEVIPEWYKFPVFYFSNHRAVYGPDDFVPYPRQSQAMDFELEIACVIGKEGRDIPLEQAADYIAGYMVMNDWSSRDIWQAESKLNMGPAKSKDFATSLGPWLVTPDELEDRRLQSGPEERYNLTMTARLNGQEISRGNFKDIYFTFPRIIERASLNTWLMPGDVLGSGTVGTGCLLEKGDARERWLQPGDVMELEIERLGVLRNTVVNARD